LRGDPDLERKHVKTDVVYEDWKQGKVIHVKYEGPISGLKTIDKIVNERKME